MQKKKYTLPRHTNIARTGRRTGAAIIDLSIFLAITIGLTYGVFVNVFKSKTTPLYNKIVDEQLASSLFYEKEEGVLTYPDKDTSVEEFTDRLHSFYTVYLKEYAISHDMTIKTPEGVVVEYSTEWFNEYVLGIKGDNPDAETDKGLFTYAKTAGEYDTTLVGVPKATSNSGDVNSYLQKQLVPAIQNIFYRLPDVFALVSSYNFYYTLSFTLGALISGIIIYIAIPLILKNGVTPGKKLFKLCLANSEGYKFKNVQLLMRFMPVAVVLLAGLLPIFTDIFYVVLAYLVVFLVSFTLMMASPKKASLHDFTARTIVVEADTSILFENELEEEIYICKEDNIPLETNNESGEEPELRYEK